MTRSLEVNQEDSENMKNGGLNGRRPLNRLDACFGPVSDRVGSPSGFTKKKFFFMWKTDRVL